MSFSFENPNQESLTPTNPEKIPSKEDILEGMKMFPENVQLMFRRLLELRDEEKSLGKEMTQSLNGQFGEMSAGEVQERISNPTEIQKLQSKNEGDYLTNRQIEIAEEQSHFWAELGKVTLETPEQRQLADYRRLFNNFLYGKNEKPIE